MCETVEKLEKCDEDRDIMGEMVVIDGFEISEEFRDKGFDSQFLSEILSDLQITNLKLVGLIPGFYTGGVREKQLENRKIQRFYMKYGFTILDLSLLIFYGQYSTIIMRNAELLDWR